MIIPRDFVQSQKLTTGTIIAKSAVDMKSCRALSCLWLLVHVIRLFGHVITIFIAKILFHVLSILAFRMWRLVTPMQMQINPM